MYAHVFPPDPRSTTPSGNQNPIRVVFVHHPYPDRSGSLITIPSDWYPTYSLPEPGVSPIPIPYPDSSSPLGLGTPRSTTPRSTNVFVHFVHSPRKAAGHWVRLQEIAGMIWRMIWNIFLALPVWVSCSVTYKCGGCPARSPRITGEAASSLVRINTIPGSWCTTGTSSCRWSAWICWREMPGSGETCDRRQSRKSDLL